MSSPTNSVTFPVINQAFNLSVCMRNPSGQRITGGLASVAAQVSLNDGAFSSAGVTVSELPASSGVLSVDLGAAAMNANKIVLVVTATGANDVVVVLSPADMSEFTGRADAQPLKKLEAYIFKAWSKLFNQETRAGNTLALYKSDSTTVDVSYPITRGATTTRGKGQ